MLLLECTQVVRCYRQGGGVHYRRRKRRYSCCFVVSLCVMDVFIFFKKSEIFNAKSAALPANLGVIGPSVNYGVFGIGFN